MAYSFEKDIKPYFNATDQDHMSFMFDLWSASDVCENASEIRDAIVKKRMPQGNPWDDKKIAQFIAVFDPWKAEGCAP